MRNKPSILTGALIGLLIAPPLIVLFALGNAVLGLPFIPFDLFDWLVPVLPADLLNTGKEAMIAVITGLGLGRLDTTAKIAEQAMGIGIVILLSVVASALFFAVMNAIRRSDDAMPSSLPGIILSLIVGVPLLLISLTVNFDASAAPLIAGIWIIGLSLVWGMTIHAIYTRLAQPIYLPPTAPVPESGQPMTRMVSAEAIDRRQFIIRLGASTAAITVLGAGVTALLGGTGEGETASRTGTSVVDLPDGLPNEGDTVEPVPGTRSELTPVEEHYRIDIRSTPLVIDPEGYTLPITNGLDSGAVLKTYTLEQIREFPATDAYITMSCISNPVAGVLISTVRWTGVSMQTFLADVGIPEGATHLKITGGDGFDEVVDLAVIAEDERVMLAYDWDGQPLTNKYGFPLRIHIPDRFGMKQPKWIVGMEFIGQDEDGYWVRRGWDKEARVRATSVIDTVYIDNIAENEGTTIIPIGGMAWAGARGLSRVEIRIDGGEWTPVELRAPISDRTWQLWRYDWEFSEGSHTFEVRCIEADGTPQIEQRAGTLPSGATGYHQVRESISV